MSFLECRHLQNNVILSGIPEELWHDIEKLKTKLIEKISWALPAHFRQEAMKKIIFCYYYLLQKRIQKYDINRTKPIAITFLNHEGQEFLLKLKKSLPKGIYVEEEYPPEIIIARVKSWLIFKYVAQSDTYKEKYKMLYDSVLIDGKKYGITDLLKLPDEEKSLKNITKMTIIP